MNLLKWLLVFIIIAAGVVANSYYAEVAAPLRASIGIVMMAVVLGIAYLTTQGQQAWAFIKGSRTELRKVVWPTRQETIQTTMVVVMMVVITAFILWGMDSLFMWLVGLLTGQRG